MPQSAVTGLAHDADGYLWVGTGAGIARFDGDTFVAYPRSTGEGPIDDARAVTTDRQGRIWVLQSQAGAGGPSGRAGR